MPSGRVRVRSDGDRPLRSLVASASQSGREGVGSEVASSLIEGQAYEPPRSRPQCDLTRRQGMRVRTRPTSAGPVEDLDAVDGVALADHARADPVEVAQNVRLVGRRAEPRGME